MEKKDIVFGLDIGTRNVIGTVGYLDGENRNQKRRKKNQGRKIYKC